MCLEKRMKVIEMSQIMSQREITKEIEISKYDSHEIQKKHAYVGSILDTKKIRRPSKLQKKRSKKSSGVIGIQHQINNSSSNT